MRECAILHSYISATVNSNEFLSQSLFLLPPNSSPIFPPKYVKLCEENWMLCENLKCTHSCSFVLCEELTLYVASLVVEGMHVQCKFT
jgi:hypothetical protein